MKKILIAFIATLFLNFVVAAQQLDRDCKPVGVPAACEDEKRAVEEIQTRLNRAQQQLQRASPAGKPALLRRIEGLNAELSTAKAALNRCIRENAPTPPTLQPSTLAVHVVGTATLETTNGKARGPFDVELDIDARFSRNRCDVIITRFPTITTQTDRIALLGRRVTVEITENSAGTGGFHPISRQMAITMKLHFHYRTGYADPDDATFYLSTDSSVTRRDGTVVTGSALDNEGKIKLVGSGRFLHGFLAGSTGRLIIDATLSPLP